MAFDQEQTSKIIAQTQNWIREIVIGCNFCPFAAREVKRNSIRYQLSEASTLQAGREDFLQECLLLDREPVIATTLLIFPAAFPGFPEYLDLVTVAEKLIKQKKYTGTYQVAGFHPFYQFAGTGTEDAANYTNRSIYPMLHILREADIEKALQHYANPAEIPARNIHFAREKGTAYMKMLRDQCL